ncbi:hypothetical protein E2F43_03265 [Seongchinamella unica]|uniref:Uncharacterized protein n=1 Tax=Seongchinamella unica TaxID=2547392 RepID=A0A4R5LVL7_9GAMM|nr:hypothetical protein [Seongchinamella unica]TDG15268.1 hypothetical protein E2F43_03265 [Seongchinamella unica]
MKRMDEGKVSLVEFLSSIKFARHSSQDSDAATGNRFARFDQRVPVPRQFGAEDSFLVRSAN